ncbi:MAG: hypothetical protein ACYC09_13980 [Bacteroidota bacterium]
MKSLDQISELRNCGFYELKRLLGLGDERLRMVLTAGEVQPIRFTNPKTNKIDEMWPLFAVKEALRSLQGSDIRILYENKKVMEMDAETRAKSDDVQLRLLRRQKKRKAI